MKFLLFAWLLALSACGSQPGSPEACAFVVEGRLPIQLFGGLPVVTIKLNGKDARMVLDTGSSITVAFAGAFRRLNLARESTVHASVTIAGDSVGVVVGRVGTVLLGEAKRTDVRIIVVDAPSVEKADIAGLLGADLLGEFDLDVDYAKPEATLYRKRSCPQGGPNWSASYQQLPRPPQREALAANVIEVVLDGIPQNAKLATGVRLTGIDRTNALESRAPAETLAAIQQAKARSTFAPAAYKFGSLTIGSEIIANPVINVSPKGQQIGNQYVRMVIGSDYLAKRRLWIAYGDLKAFVGQATP